MNLSEEVTNVLVAEDDDDDYLIFCLAVDETEIATIVTRAENGEVLMSTLKEKIPDILFLDIHMPCKDGKECLLEIRSNKRYDHLPIIIYSSFKDIDTIEYCFRKGSNLYAIKPVEVKSLTKMLKAILLIDWKNTLYYPPKSEFIVGL